MTKPLNVNQEIGEIPRSVENVIGLLEWVQQDSEARDRRYPPGGSLLSAVANSTFVSRLDSEISLGLGRGDSRAALAGLNADVHLAAQVCRRGRIGRS